MYSILIIIVNLEYSDFIIVKYASIYFELVFNTQTGYFFFIDIIKYNIHTYVLI